MKRKLKTKYKKLIINGSIFVLVLLFGFSMIPIGQKIYYEKEASKVQEMIINQVIRTDVIEGETKQQIDFSKLKAMNPDVVGWIEIPKTNINYAIVKGQDNSFYLNHDLLRKYNIYGSVFMNYQNSSDFSDNNTILFGHNTYKDTIFGELIKIQEGKLGNDIKIIIHTEASTMEYLVYAAYITDESDETPLDKHQAYFESNHSLFQKRENLKQTLTLSTCYYDETKRVIIHAGKMG